MGVLTLKKEELLQCGSHADAGAPPPVPLRCLFFTSTASVSHSLSQGVKDSQLLPPAVLAHVYVALGEKRGSISRLRAHSGRGGWHSIVFGKKS